MTALAPLRRFVAIVAAATAFGSMACAADTETKEGTTVDEGQLTNIFFGGGTTTGTISTVYVPPPRYTPQQLNAFVGQAWRYVLGGPAPTQACNDGSSVLTKAPGLVKLRSAVAAYGTSALVDDTHGDPEMPKGTCQITKADPAFYPNGTKSVDGLTVGVAHLYCYDVADAFDAINAMTKGTMPVSTLDQCWDNSGSAGYSASSYAASDFFQITALNEQHGCSPAPCSYTNKLVRMDIDPEPAHLNGSLAGSGTYASAYFTNGGASTWGYQWPSSWAVGSVPAGYPCATYAAAAGTLLYSTIQASGSYRKCM